MLVEPFDKAPSEPRNQWQEFEREYTTRDINSAVRERMYRDALQPEYKIDISQDMQEYLACQEIPHFGMHFYYAFSPTETINHWHNFNKLKVPKKTIQALERMGQLKQEIFEESLIQGRFTEKLAMPRPRKVVSKKKSLIKKAKKSSKPKWEGGIEESPEPAPEKRNLISIPTNVSAKNIPPKLQRRMLEAEQKSIKEKLKLTQFL